MTLIPYKDVLERSACVIGAKYVFNSVVPIDAPCSKLRAGTDCAEFVGWLYGPWRHLLDGGVPQYTGAIQSWAAKTGRLKDLSKRKPGDLVLRAPGVFNIKIGHVGVVLADVNVIRQARSTKAGCGDWAYNTIPWKYAVDMPVAAPGAAPSLPVVDYEALFKFIEAMKNTQLRLGSSGPFVEVLQDKLKVGKTGFFGLETDAALRAWQQFYNALLIVNPRPDGSRLPIPEAEYGVTGLATWDSLLR